MTLLVGQFTQRAELYASSRQGRHKRKGRWGLCPLELTAHLGAGPSYTHSYASRLMKQLYSTMKDCEQKQYTNEGWCQGCFFIPRDCPYLENLKSLESCDKKIPGPMDNSWFFKAIPTF